MKDRTDYLWGLILITVGLYWLIPDDVVPNGTAHLIFAILALGYAIISGFRGEKPYLLSCLGLGFGLYGLSQIFLLGMSVWPIALICIGIYLLISKDEEEVIKKKTNTEEPKMEREENVIDITEVVVEEDNKGKV